MIGTEVTHTVQSACCLVLSITPPQSDLTTVVVIKICQMNIVIPVGLETQGLGFAAI